MASESNRERQLAISNRFPALRHPRICVLYDIGHDQGVEFLVMELLEGETLEHEAEKGCAAARSRDAVRIEIAEALHSAHRAGITHRDLKPGNIMLTKDGAKLLDFGLAKFGARAAASAGATAMPTLTSEGTIVGTFQYMAPEQLEGKNADERTDLFVFGAVVYEMITGRKRSPATAARMWSRQFCATSRRRCQRFSRSRRRRSTSWCARVSRRTPTRGCNRRTMSLSNCAGSATASSGREHRIDVPSPHVDSGVGECRPAYLDCGVVPDAAPAAGACPVVTLCVRDAPGQPMNVSSARSRPRTVTRWPAPRVPFRRGDDGWWPVDGPRHRSGRPTAACRNCERVHAVLFSRQPMDWLLRGRGTQEGGDRRRTGGFAGRCERGATWGQLGR